MITYILYTSLLFRFKAVSRSYYHGADGIILMYDITQEHTFLAIREWIDSIKETTGAMPPSVLLLGNKLDRIETASDRGVSHEAGETMAKIFGAHFVEVSAKTGQNVADSYYAMIRCVCVCVRACVRVCVRVCMYAHVCVCVCMCKHVHSHTSLLWCLLYTHTISPYMIMWYITSFNSLYQPTYVISTDY